MDYQELSKQASEIIGKPVEISDSFEMKNPRHLCVTFYPEKQTILNAIVAISSETSVKIASSLKVNVVSETTETFPNGNKCVHVHLDYEQQGQGALQNWKNGAHAVLSYHAAGILEKEGIDLAALGITPSSGTGLFH